MLKSIDVQIDRDSVCAGDDTEAHVTHVALPESASIMDLLELVQSQRLLASIIGGQATWLIGVGEGYTTVIGVMAQQWDSPRLIIPDETMLSSLFADQEPRVFFRYWLQVDPSLVFACLQSGAELPRRA